MTAHRFEEPRMNAGPYPDIPRIRKLVEWVEEQEALPEDQREWNQCTWVKSSALREARKALREADDWSTRTVLQSEVLRFDCGTKACVCGRLALDNGAEIAVDAFASVWINGKLPGVYGRETLGLTAAEASIFDSFNTAATVRHWGEQIAARVGETL